MIRHVAAWAVSFQVCWLSGCGGPEPPEVPPTSPVTGTVKIDGKPEAGVKVMLFPADKLPEFVDPNAGAPHLGLTDDQGKFQITSFNTGDGAPAGEYVMLFNWAGHPKAVPFENPDEAPTDPKSARFNGKYGNVMKPAVPNVKVEEGKPTDVGMLELTTKK